MHGQAKLNSKTLLCLDDSSKISTQSTNKLKLRVLRTGTEDIEVTDMIESNDDQ